MRHRVGSVDPLIGRRADEVLRKSGNPRLPNGVGIDLERIVAEYYRLQLRYHPDLTLSGRSLLAAYIPSFPFLFVHRAQYRRDNVSPLRTSSGTPSWRTISDQRKVFLRGRKRFCAVPRTSRVK